MTGSLFIAFIGDLPDFFSKKFTDTCLYLPCFLEKMEKIMSVKQWLFLLLLFPSLAATAQYGGGYGRNGGMGSDMGASNDSRSVTNICRVFGRIVDSTGQPLKDVSVILQQQDNDPNPMPPQGDEKPEDPYYKEVVTKKNGKFTFSSLPFFHQYKLTVMADGYKRWEQDIRFIPKQEKHRPAEEDIRDSVKAVVPPVKTRPSPDKDMKDIKLTPLPKK